MKQAAPVGGPPPRQFIRLGEGILDVAPIVAELQAQPELWNQYRERTTSEASPHAEVGDIWLRYFPRAQVVADLGSVIRPGHCEFYPAWDRLPALHGLVYALMGAVRATELGGILITRIPPGGRVAPHDDGHSWHARRMNTKVYVPLWTNARCVNRCLEDEVVMRVGEAWIFDNTLTHSVENNGDTERATLIVSLRTEPSPPVVRQPIEGMHLYAGSFVKSHVVPDAGTVMPQHAHTYPHMSFIASGAVRVERDGEVVGEFQAPAHVEIPARAMHRFVTLAPNTTILCIHATDAAEAADVDEERLIHEHHEPPTAEKERV